MEIALKNKNIKLVTFDWLEHCLLRGRKLKEAKYEWQRLDKKTAKRNKLKKNLNERQSGSEDSGSPDLTLTSAIQDHLGKVSGPAASKKGNKKSAKDSAKSSLRQAKSDFQYGVTLAKSELYSGMCRQIRRSLRTEV